MREKRWHISTLYAKFAALHAKYTHYLPWEIEDNEEIYEDILDIDSERNQICLAVIDFAGHARRVFDQTDISDKNKLYYVAKNCERKRLQMEK